MITIFLPCRAGSVRVKNKNTRKFAGIEGGLFAVKLNSLLSMPYFDELIVSTNDAKIIEIASSFQSKDRRIRVDVRPEHLAASSTRTDDLIKYVPQIIKDGTVLWTHVTSPFIREETYENAITKYNEYYKAGTHDSVMSVNKIQTFLWTEEGPYNYDYKEEKWPRTQTIQPLYEVNSAFFISDIDNYIKHNNRIGVKPYLYQIEGLERFDIDWEEDFMIAEKIWRAEKW